MDYPTDINLYLNNDKQISSYKLKNKLFEFKIKDRCCENCKLDVWLNGQIPLELHHIDGNHYNNKLGNIQILCPNCHSLTSTYRGRGKKIEFTSNELEEAVKECETINQIVVKFKLLSNASSYRKIRHYLKKYNLKLKDRVKASDIKELRDPNYVSETRKLGWIKSRKVIRPSKEELLEMVWEKSISTLAKELGISDNGIRKWANIYNIPVPPVGYWAKFNNGHFDQCDKIKDGLFKEYNI